MYTPVNYNNGGIMYTPVNKSTGVMPGAVMVGQSLHILLFTFKFSSGWGLPKTLVLIANVI